MNREQAINYLRSSGMSNEQIESVCEGLGCLEERPHGERWIPVSVQEPDVGGMYFVTAKDVRGYIGTDIARRVSDNVWTFGGEELPCVEIIAWQPLPKPYKEAENEECPYCNADMKEKKNE